MTPQHLKHLSSSIWSNSSRFPHILKVIKIIKIIKEIQIIRIFKMTKMINHTSQLHKYTSNQVIKYKSTHDHKYTCTQVYK